MHTVVIGRVGDEDTVVVESAIGHEYVKVHVQLKRRAEALHEGDGATRQLTKPASTKTSALPQKQHAQTRLQCGRDEVWSTAQCQSDRIGNVKAHCRYGTRGSTQSTSWAAVSSARRAVHDGQIPRRLHENGTST